MIIDSPFVGNLAQGADRVIPQDGDGQLIVIPILQPSIEPITAHHVATLTTDLANTSRFVEYSISRLNQAFLLDPFLFLPKGLYEVEVGLTARSNFTPAALTDTIGFQIVYETFTVTLMPLMLNAETAGFRSVHKFLLSSQATLQMAIPATNAVATNTLQVRAGFNIIRLL